MRYRAILLLGALGCLAGCSSSEEPAARYECTPTDGGLPTPTVVPLRCDRSGAAPCDTQVVTRVLIPGDATEAKKYGYDQDGDGTIDNALGAVFSAVSGAANVDMQRNLDDDWVAGDAIDLIRRQRASASTKAGGQWILGHARGCCDDPSVVDACRKQAVVRCFSGSATFSIESASGAMPARTSGGRASYGPGRGTIRLPVGPGHAVSLRVEQLGFEWPRASDRARAEGRVYGAIPADEVERKLLPVMATFLDNFLTHSDSDPRSVKRGLNLFDADGDGHVSTQEFADNDLVKTFFSGDLDLDGDCKADALSFGFGFWSVPARVR